MSYRRLVQLKYKNIVEKELVMRVKLKNINNDYLISIIHKLYSILIGVISSAFYIRYLGLEYKGVYSYINEIASIVVLILNLGIYQSYSYYYRENKDNIYKEYTELFIVQFFIYLLISIGMIILFHRNQILTMVVMLVPFNIIKLQFDNVIMVEKIKLYLVVDIVLKTVGAIVYFLLWKFADVNLFYLNLYVILTDIIVCVVYLYKTKDRLIEKKVWINKEFTKKVVRFGYLPMLSSLLMTLNYSVDIIFLQHLGTNEELSLYSLAAVIMNYVWLIPNAFKDVLISRIARTDDRKAVEFSTKMSLFLTLICMIGFSILGKILLAITFGADFVNSYGVTMILFIGAFSMIFFKMFGVVLVTEGKRQVYFWILFISVIMNIISNLVFIPMFGMYGAAWASVISYTVCGSLFLIYYCRYKRFSPRDFIFINKEDIKILKSYFKK